MEDTPSPCIEICELNKDDICTGCGRSKDEIASWGLMPQEGKKRCVLRSRHRLLQLNKGY